MNIKNRIVDKGDVEIEQILFNPKNWRLHPKEQQTSLQGVLERIGWVQQVIINTQTGNLIDGHLRVQLAARNGDKTIPAIYVDLSEQEEAIILATLDPLGAMAATDREKYAELLSFVEADTEAVKKLLDEISEREGLNAIPSDGNLLALSQVAIGDPKHKVYRGDVYKVANHYLICESVISGWSIWAEYLTSNPGWLFVPYPGAFIPLSERANENYLVMVQPDEYICGHILDRYAEIYGEESIRLC